MNAHYITITAPDATRRQAAACTCGEALDPTAHRPKFDAWVSNHRKASR